MDAKKWGVLGLAGALLVSYNLSQSGIMALRNNEKPYPGTQKREAYGPKLDWLDRLASSSTGGTTTEVDPRTGELKLKTVGNVKLDFSVLSSLMVAGLASGFKSQVANLLWMKSDEYWHQGLFTRQVPLMEAVVTLDPQFIDAWSTAGWHWAYNIYADIPMNPDYKKKGDKAIRAAQENAILTGLDYLERGSSLNPDTYRLWFEYGWTRAEKAGYYDDKTLALYQTARKKPDAREIEITGPDGQARKEQGIDLMGRTIGHLLESIPDFDKALNHYAGELMKIKPDSQERKMLDAAGEYWGRYGSDYPIIADLYTNGDAITRTQIKKLVPDVERLVAAQNMRNKVASTPGNDQPVGAYVSITARYIPTWKLLKAGKLDEAEKRIIGVMQVDPKVHLQGLNVMRTMYELRGDSPQAIEQNMKNAKEAELTSTQDLGINLLAKIYEAQAAKYRKLGDKKNENAYNRLAYETWYRARTRNALNFYALRNTLNYESKYGFTEPKAIVEEIKKSRQGGTPSAAPQAPPNVQQYYR